MSQEGLPVYQIDLLNKRCKIFGKPDDAINHPAARKKILMLVHEVFLYIWWSKIIFY